MIEYSVDSTNDAMKFIERSRLKPSQIEEQDVVEYHDLSVDTDDVGEKNRDQQLDLSGISMPALQERFKIKMERVDLLERSVKQLNNRIGTEIILDGENKENELSASCSMSVPRYENTINTLNYQIDETFGKKIYFMTDVRIIFFIFFLTIN